MSEAPGDVLDPSPRWVRPLLVTAGLAFAAVQVAAWPVAIAAQDEASYLAGAYILRHGTVFADVAQVPLLWRVPHAGHTALLYPPGQSALLAPFTFGGWRLAFAANLLAHLTGFLLFSVLLKQLGIRRAWALLYLFFPPLVLYSRTLMSDVPSATLTVAVLLLWLRGPKGRALAGALLGASLFLRYANLLTFIFLALAAGLGDLAALRRGTDRRWQTFRLPPLVAGFLPLCALFLAYNLVVYGHPTTPGYASAGLFGLRHLPGHLAVYGAVLMLIYPLMLLAPLLYRGRLQVEVLVISYGVLLAQSAYYFLNTYGSLAERAFVGSRLLFPAVPLFLVAYAQGLDRIVDGIRGRTQAVVAVVAGGLLLLGMLTTFFISHLHQQRLQQAAQARAVIERTAPRPALHLINGESAKFLNPAWGNRQYQVLIGQDLAVLPQPETRRPIAVIYTAHGDDTADLVTARAAATRYNARLMTDWRGEWHVMVWVTSVDDFSDALAVSAHG